MSAAKVPPPRTAADPGRDDAPALPPLPPPAARSQADEALRRVIAAQPVQAPARPLSRRAATVWGR